MGQLVKAGLAPTRYERWKGGSRLATWFLNKQIQWDPNYFRNRARSDGEAYFLEVRTWSSLRIDVGSGKGHAELAS